ncbi:MAG: squalene--hopene cyclase, partial [Pirellulales bacterium]
WLLADRACAAGPWEVTPQSQVALSRGLAWLARSQGPNGNWGSADLGLVALGSLAFLAAGHLPGRGSLGKVPQRALEHIMRSARPDGLLNIAHQRRDMYNHGLATFVLGQAYGMMADDRLQGVFRRALRLIEETQCDDGGWDYVAEAKPKGHDLSLSVMQAKALRTALDSGLEVSPRVINLAIANVRQHYRPNPKFAGPEELQRQGPGIFSYDGRREGNPAMAAAGVVCLQEFGQYDDWRIPNNIGYLVRSVRGVKPVLPGSGSMPFDPYTMYYVGQAMYQAGGDAWRQVFPRLRDEVVRSQQRDENDPAVDGSWQATKYLQGAEGQLYATAVACFVLAIPNRYLPILQEGRIREFVKR